MMGYTNGLTNKWTPTTIYTDSTPGFVMHIAYHISYFLCPKYFLQLTHHGPIKFCSTFSQTKMKSEPRAENILGYHTI